MRIGILREEKNPPDNRVVLSPAQCMRLEQEYPDIELFVQSSQIRCYSDEEYQAHHIQVVEDISHCDVLFGVKEVPIKKLIPKKTYFFFSHTIKKQEYNRSLLQAMIQKQIRMIDYEVLKDNQGKRILGFGRFAGIVGAYNGLLTYGLKSEKFDIKPANRCANRFEMEKELSKLELTNEKIVLTGFGRVGEGATETLLKAGIREVSKEEFLTSTYQVPVFTHLNTMDYYERIDKGTKNKNEFYQHPELYRSSFMQFAQVADIFIAGHFYSMGSPFLFTKEDVRDLNFNLSVVADISCDIDGPVATTIRSSQIQNPIYGYNPITEKEDDFNKQGIIAVMAVDNLPSELPKDASTDFGENLLSKVFPLLLTQDKDEILENATICKKGFLTKNFIYLTDYLNGL